MATTGKGLPRSLKGVTFSASWTEITGKPAVIAAGATAAAAWSVIQSGAIGTTATTAMAGNKVPTTTQRGGVLQTAAIVDLASQTVTGADATAVAASAQTAVNAVVTKLNTLLAQMRTGGEIAP